MCVIPTIREHLQCFIIVYVTRNLLSFVRYEPPIMCTEAWTRIFAVVTSLWCIFVVMSNHVLKVKRTTISHWNRLYYELRPGWFKIFVSGLTLGISLLLIAEIADSTPELTDKRCLNYMKQFIETHRPWHGKLTERNSPSTRTNHLQTCNYGWSTVKSIQTILLVDWRVLTLINALTNHNSGRTFFIVSTLSVLVVSLGTLQWASVA